MDTLTHNIYVYNLFYIKNKSFVFKFAVVLASYSIAHRHKT